MTPENFAYWLHGFFEISNSDTLTEEQVQVIKDHLSLLFNKKTPDYKDRYPEKKSFTLSPGVSVIEMDSTNIQNGPLGTIQLPPLDDSLLHSSGNTCFTMTPEQIEAEKALICSKLFEEKETCKCGGFNIDGFKDEILYC